MKTFKLTITEEEIKALIRYHADNLNKGYHGYDVETSERIHTLTKRLNKDTPEIESELVQRANAPRSEFMTHEEVFNESAQSTASKEEQQTGW